MIMPHPLFPLDLRLPPPLGCCCPEIRQWHFLHHPPIIHYHKKVLGIHQPTALIYAQSSDYLLGSKSLQTANLIKENNIHQIKFEYNSRAIEWQPGIFVFNLQTASTSSFCQELFFIHSIRPTEQPFCQSCIFLLGPTRGAIYRVCSWRRSLCPPVAPCMQQRASKFGSAQSPVAEQHYSTGISPT